MSVSPITGILLTITGGVSYAPELIQSLLSIVPLNNPVFKDPVWSKVSRS